MFHWSPSMQISYDSSILRQDYGIVLRLRNPMRFTSCTIWVVHLPEQNRNGPAER